MTGIFVGEIALKETFQCWDIAAQLPKYLAPPVEGLRKMKVTAVMSYRNDTKMHLVVEWYDKFCLDAAHLDDSLSIAVICKMRRGPYKIFQ